MRGGFREISGDKENAVGFGEDEISRHHNSAVNLCEVPVRG